MSEMIERVAQRLRSEPLNTASGNQLALSEEAAWRLARAAIEAMREPTQAMVASISNGAESWNIRIAQDWRGMIDAALA